MSISAGLAFLRTPDGKDILEEAEHVWCKELRKEIWKGTLMPARTTFANMWESLEWAAQFSGLRNPADPVKTVTAVGQKLVAISFQSSMNHTMDCFVDELRRFWKFAKKVGIQSLVSTTLVWCSRESEIGVSLLSIGGISLWISL